MVADGLPAIRGASRQPLPGTGHLALPATRHLTPPAQVLTRSGRTNPQIDAELYISTSTASVHVSNILRKLGVPGRVQAAALAERAGLLVPGQP